MCRFHAGDGFLPLQIKMRRTNKATDCIQNRGSESPIRFAQSARSDRIVVFSCLRPTSCDLMTSRSRCDRRQGFFRSSSRRTEGALVRL
jgi:hypothetical protein